jgi:hypothetical protein
MGALRKFTTIGIAALTIGTGLAAATPASAQYWGGGGWGRPGWGGGWGRPAYGWGGGGWGYRGGYYGGGYGYGAGLAGAALGAAVVGGIIANSNRCYHNYPRYDAWGNFIGYTTGSGPCY